MKKVVFESVGNVLLFVLMGLAFMFPFSRYEGGATADGFSLSVHLSPLMAVFVVFLVLYPIARAVFVRRSGLHASTRDNLELAADDERELQITGRALRTAYRVLMTCLILGLGALAAAQFLSATFLGDAVVVYRTAVGIIAATLVVASASYCIRWCLEYRK